MKAGKLLLLVGILAFGAAVELASLARSSGHWGPEGWRVFAGRFYGPSFSFESERREALAAGARVAVRNAFGEVQVVAGEPGAVRVRLRSVVYRSTQAEAAAFAKLVRVEARLDGDTLRITTNRDELEPRNVGLETHLLLEVPATARVAVENGHGGTQVSGVAGLEADSSFGDLRVERVAGDARLSVSHGDCEAAQLGGALTLEARHGNTTLREVAGRIELDAEHGDVSLERVGAVTAGLRHGEFRARTVRGALQFRGEHADVSAREVGGDATVETAYRDVVLETVAGGVRVKSEHGRIEARDVDGALEVETAYDAVRLERIRGAALVRVEHGGVSAAQLAAGGSIRASGETIEVDGFGGPLEIDSGRGGVQILARAPLAGALTVRAENGDLELELWPEGGLDLLATAEPGEVHVELAGFVPSESSESRVAGRRGDAAVPVRLSARHGDVDVTTAGATHAATQ